MKSQSQSHSCEQSQNAGESQKSGVETKFGWLMQGQWFITGNTKTDLTLHSHRISNFGSNCYYIKTASSLLLISWCSDHSTTTLFAVIAAASVLRIVMTDALCMLQGPFCSQEKTFSKAKFSKAKFWFDLFPSLGVSWIFNTQGAFTRNEIQPDFLL